jgi:hypothetical protein
MPGNRASKLPPNAAASRRQPEHDALSDYPSSGILNQQVTIGTYAPGRPPSHEASEHIPGLHRVKESDRPTRVVISRPIQDDETLPPRVAQQIPRKMLKLRRYKADGYATLLILETQDQSLMNQHKMLEAMREGLDGSMPEGLDQIRFTEARGAYFFDFAKPIREGHDILD